MFAVAWPVAPAAAAFPGANGLIAFTIEDSAEVYHLKVVDPETGAVREVAQGTEPDFSADGRMIAFRDTGGPSPSIGVVSTDGGTPQTLGEGLDPTWSPDGRRIAFLRQGADGVTLWVMNADGSDRHLVASHVPTGASTSYIFAPAWSPDGTRIAYAAPVEITTGDPVCTAPDTSVHWDLFTVSPDGGSRTALTNDCNGEAAPSWSPDGSKLVFHQQEEAACGRLVTMPAGGGATTPLTSCTAGNSQTAPVWSPDGRRIAYGQQVNTTGSSLRIAEYPGGGSTTVPAADDSLMAFAWQPRPVRITEGPEGPTTEGRPTFRFDAPAGTSLECRLDGPGGTGTWSACSASFQPGPLTPGAYTARVRLASVGGDGAARAFVVLDPLAATLQAPLVTENFGFGPISAGQGVPLDLLEAAAEANAFALALVAGALADGAPVEVGAPDAGDADLTVYDTGGTASRATGPRRRVLARGRATAGAAGMLRVKLRLTPAAKRLVKRGVGALRGGVEARFDSATGAPVSSARRTTVTFAASSPVRSVRLRGKTRVVPRARLRGTVRLRHRPRGRVTIRLTADGRAEGSRVIASVKPRRRALAFRARLPRGVRGAFDVLACAKPTGRAPAKALACARARRPLQVGGAVARPAAAADPAAVEALLRRIYEFHVQDAVDAMLAEPQAPLTDAYAMKAMDDAVILKARFDLLGAQMPDMERFLIALPRLADRALEAAFNRCISTPGLAHVRAFMAVAERAVNFGGRAPTLRDMLLRCARFQVRLALTFAEEGTVADDQGRVQPYSLRRTLSLSNYGAPGIYQDWTAAPEMRIGPMEKLCFVKTDPGAVRLDDLTLTSDPNSSTNPALPLTVGITAYFEELANAGAAMLECTTGPPAGINIAMAYRHLTRITACLAPYLVEGSRAAFRFTTETSQNPVQVVKQDSRPCYETTTPEGLSAKLVLRRVKFTVRHIPDLNGAVTDQALAELDDDRNAPG